jgi:hypothetical protein
MRLYRVQFTMRRMMITIAIAAVLLAIVILRHRRIQRFDRMVINQQITTSSADANLGNASLAREAAEYSLREYTEKYYRPPAEILQNKAAQAPVSAEQLRLLTNQEMEQANAEKLFARIIQQVDEGNYPAGFDAPTAALVVIKKIQALEKRASATRASQVAGAQGPLEKTRINIEVDIERARGQERIKKMISEYEKAYLKSLKRERANVWW